MGKKRVGVERVNVTVPAKLRQKMAITEGINWSSVAAAAFKDAIEAESLMAVTESGDEPFFEPNDFSSRWADAMRKKLQLAASLHRRKYPALKTSLYTPSHDAVLATILEREMGMTIAGRDFALKLQRGTPDTSAHFTFETAFSDEDLQVLNLQDYPVLSQDPKAMYEVLARAEDVNLMVGASEAPDPQVLLMGVRTKERAKGFDEDALHGAYARLRIAHERILHYLAGADDDQYWDPMP